MGKISVGEGWRGGWGALAVEENMSERLEKDE